MAAQTKINNARNAHRFRCILSGYIRSRNRWKYLSRRLRLMNLNFIRGDKKICIVSKPLEFRFKTWKLSFPSPYFQPYLLTLTRNLKFLPRLFEILVKSKIKILRFDGTISWNYCKSWCYNKWIFPLHEFRADRIEKEIWIFHF